MDTNPTQAQFRALERFAERHGTMWKTVLLGLWSQGIEDRVQDGALLRQIRNQLGPDWLKGFARERYAHEYACGHFEPTVEEPRYYDHLCPSCASQRPAH